MPPSDDAAIYDEVAILASLDHPYIVPLIDFFEEKDCYFIVMELMSGGDLFDRIGKKKAYSEADARDLCSKMLKAMAYCHTKNIAHCDMKPKNLLLTVSSKPSKLKQKWFALHFFFSPCVGCRATTMILTLNWPTLVSLLGCILQSR